MLLHCGMRDDCLKMSVVVVYFLRLLVSIVVLRSIIIKRIMVIIKKINDMDTVVSLDVTTEPGGSQG